MLTVSVRKNRDLLLNNRSRPRRLGWSIVLICAQHASRVLAAWAVTMITSIGRILCEIAQKSCTSIVELTLFRCNCYEQYY